jgi:hypothetical protein
MDRDRGKNFSSCIDRGVFTKNRDIDRGKGLG